MSIEKAIVSILSNAAAVTGIVGSHIFPIFVPQQAKDKLPAITYQQISAPRDHVMSGPTGLVNARFQISCWSKTYLELRDFADAVRTTLDGYADTVLGTEIQAVLLLDEGDMPSINPENETLRSFGKRLDFEFWFKE